MRLYKVSCRPTPQIYTRIVWAGNRDKRDQIIRTFKDRYGAGQKIDWEVVHVPEMKDSLISWLNNNHHVE